MADKDVTISGILVIVNYRLFRKYHQTSIASYTLTTQLYIFKAELFSQMC